MEILEMLEVLFSSEITDADMTEKLKLKNVHQNLELCFREEK